MSRKPLTTKSILAPISRPLPLIAQTEIALRNAIQHGKYGSGSFPAVHELSQQLQVSRETVRLALRSLEHEGLIAKLGRSRFTVNRADSRSAAPYCVVGYLEEEYELDKFEPETICRLINAKMIDGAVAEAAQRQIHIEYRRAKPFQLREAFDELMAQHGVGGMIFASVSDEKFLKDMTRQGLPGVLLDHELYDLPQFDSIRPNCSLKAELAVNHLVKLGHKRIACASWLQTSINPWFTKGYRRAMRDAKLSRRKSWELEVELTQRGALEALQYVLSLSPRPTAVICFHNTLASQVTAAARQVGVKVPGDLSVIGGGGERVAGLTCTQVDWEHLGAMAVSMLHTSMTEGEQHKPLHIQVPCKLIGLGGTARRIRGRDKP